jgi:hypothetical protein
MMDLLKKVELLLNAKARSVLPRRERRGALDEQEEAILAEIRQALQDVAAQERVLAGRIKTEQAEAEAAAQRGDFSEQQVHERRAFELERHLEQESIQAINLEEKLRALEEKLALAKEAVEKQAKEVAGRDAEASKVLAEGLEAVSSTSTAAEPPPAASGDQGADLTTRKSRLSED